MANTGRTVLRSEHLGITFGGLKVVSDFNINIKEGELVGTLSGGEQQMLATGRALMTNPKIVLMDEPSMGLSPI